VALEEYRQKRDFKKTPEPSGQDDAAITFPGWKKLPKGKRFCVQLHKATRLHFDLRLEYGGVLWSWAVPQGPPFDALEKRLAMHVEDHPIDYGEFEGVIPEGYGAGTVMLWDAGEFAWISPDPDDALKKGDLKFTLNGQKLHGEFVLVKMKRGESGKEWLLIKKKDEWVRPGVDPKALDFSVKTGRGLEEIAEEEGDPRLKAKEHRAQAKPPLVLSTLPEERMPKTLAPMLASTADKPFDSQEWLYELKFDGVRLLAFVEGGEVRLLSRNGRSETARYPELQSLVNAIGNRGALLDGEIVAPDKDGKPSFALLQQRMNLTSERDIARAVENVPVNYMIFDLLHLDGHNLRDAPLESRKRMLRNILKDDEVNRFADHVVGDGVAFFTAASRLGLEGAVGKKRDSRYLPGERSHSWVKIKAWRSQDCVICGFTRGRQSRGRLGALVLGVFEGGTMVHAGQAGSGLDEADIKALLEQLDALTSKSSPFKTEPKTMEPATWVKPELVCEVRFTEWTNEGTMRHPTFLRMRSDLKPSDCVREEPLETKEFVGESKANEPDDLLSRLARLPADGTLVVDEKEVKLTHLDKLMYPEGISKRDVIAYHIKMSDYILPYLHGRAVNANVMPDGIDGKSFWRKQVPDYAPEWVKTFRFTESKTVDYVVADDLATLIWLVNGAAIELHPWHSSIANPRQPDWAVFDLDPADGATFAQVVQIAKLVKAALDHYKLKSVLKTSGQTGLQIYVPLAVGPDFAEVRKWVEQVGRAIGQTLPDLITWKWTVSERTGKIRIDYTQNIVNKTLVMPYGLRPAKGAPVSAPIAWEELDDKKLRPDRWNIGNIADRVNEVGDLFTPLLTERQGLPPI
jgi:bifunctional non-homologous end joining protein LigD